MVLGVFNEKKFSIALNILTICLCVFASVFSVWALKTSGLSINGSIGYVERQMLSVAEDVVWGANSASSSSYPDPTISTAIVLNMGTHSGKPIRWFAFAYEKNGSMTTMPTEKSELEALLQAETKYWFVSEHVIDRRQFDTEACAYKDSDIQIYLNGDFATGMSSEPAFENINDRALTVYNGGVADTMADQKFWLLSYEELYYLNGGNAIDGNKEYNCNVGIDMYYAPSNSGIMAQYIDFGFDPVAGGGNYFLRDTRWSEYHNGLWPMFIGGTGGDCNDPTDDDQESVWPIGCDMDVRPSFEYMK